MYKVFTGTVSDTGPDKEVLEEAMNLAAEHMRTSDRAIAVVIDPSAGSDEAVIVLYNNWAYLAKEQNN